MRKALAATSEEIKLTRWVNEDEPVNLESIEDPKLNLRKKYDSVICLPDAAFVLEYKSVRAVFYLEQDRDTYFHDRVAARKSPGYQRMWEQRGHLSQFPDSSLEFFFVLFVAPNQKRRDQLKRAFAKKNANHDVHKAFRFLAFNQVTPENFLFDPLLTRCEDNSLLPLVKRVTQPTTNNQPSIELQSGLK